MVTLDIRPCVFFCIMSNFNIMKTSDTFSACWVILVFDYNPLNSGMNYRIFNIRMWSFCMCIDTGALGLLSHLKYFCRVCTCIESAQNLTLEKSQGGCKAYHITATHLFWWPRSIMLNLGFEEWVLLLCTIDFLQACRATWKRGLHSCS